MRRILKGLMIGAAVLGGLPAIAGLIGENKPAPVSTTSTSTRQSEAYAAVVVGEKVIRSVLKDPDSAVFTESQGRIKGGMHVACGYVNAKNSFGAMTGRSPWLVVVENKVAMVQSSDNASKFIPLWNKYCAGPQDGDEPQKSAPDSFRGVKWDAPLPSVQKLRETAMKGCPAVVEQKGITSNAPCSYLHIDNDDIDSFIQRQNVAPLFDVPISEQMLSWSHKKFWAGDVFIHNYKEADLAKLRSALVEWYGPPTLANDGQHLNVWNWLDKKIKITLMFDPVAKPSFGDDKTPATSISLHIAKN